MELLRHTQTHTLKEEAGLNGERYIGGLSQLTLFVTRGHNGKQMDMYDTDTHTHTVPNRCGEKMASAQGSGWGWFVYTAPGGCM